MHIIISTTFQKKINILTVKNKLKKKRPEKYLECEINAQKDKKEQDNPKSSQEITYKRPKDDFLVG
jgi:hypothetical protein